MATPHVREPLPPIPVDRTALPVLGRALHFHYRLLPSLQKLERRYGPVVRTKTGPFEHVCLFGPESLELAFRTSPESFSSKLGWSAYLDHVFPGGVMAMDGAEHATHRRILQTAFSRAALESYLVHAGPIVERHVGEWLAAGASKLPLYPALKEMTFAIASRTLLGLTAVRATGRVHRAFAQAVAASTAVLRVPFGPTTYARGIRARRFLAEEFTRVVAARRAAPREETSSLVSRLCVAETEDGERFSEREVVDHLLFVLMAAHDTTTSAISAAAYLLAKHPAWQERLRLRSLALPAGAADIDALRDLDELGFVIQEGLRMYPPLSLMPRTARVPIAYAGYEIPAGTQVTLSPLFVHYMPSLWRQPHRFDPLRFAPGREEHKSHRFAFAPFGGGAHMCIGQQFGMLEAKLALHTLLRRARWSVPDGYAAPYDLMPLARPRDGLPVRLDRLH